MSAFSSAEQSTRFLIGRAGLYASVLLIAAIAVIVVPRVLHDEPLMVVGRGLFACLVAALAFRDARHLRRPLAAAGRGPVGPWVDMDAILDAYDDLEMAEAQRAMLWFALVEAGCWQDEREAASTIDERERLRSSELSFVNLARCHTIREIQLEQLRPRHRRTVDLLFRSSGPMDNWLISEATAPALT